MVNIPEIRYAVTNIILSKEEYCKNQKNPNVYEKRLS